MSQFKSLDIALAPLIAAGLSLPYPLAEAIKDNPLPLALSTRSAWPEWAAAHGYAAEQIDTLMQSIGRLRSAAGYLHSLAADGSARFDADGEATEPVSDLDRHTAVLMLHARALSKSALVEGALRNAPGVRPQKAAAAETYDDRLSPPKALTAAAAAATGSPTSTLSTPDSPKPQAQPKRETIRLGGLSPAEIERR